MPETRYGFPPDAFDPLNLPDYDHEFLASGHLDEFAKALIAPDTDSFVSLNDWKPVHQRVRRKLPHAPTGRRRRKPRRSRDETREGFMYTIFKWPLLLIILSWIVGLGASYWLTRLYVWAYEGLVTWRGSRQRLRRRVRSATSYEDWRRAAQELDGHLGNEGWKDTAAYAYYDHATIARAAEQLKAGLRLAQDQGQDPNSGEATAALRAMVESCVKTNFVGLENPRLYSETYYGTKHLAQDFVNELHASLAYLFRSPRIEKQAKYQLAKQLHTNFGRTALCLSGGANFAWYHLGVVKALLDRSLLPDIVTGTSGGALVAALVCTRTDEQLRALLVPSLAHRIKACAEPFSTWFPRFWKTGARFDSLRWAQQCSWFTGGSLTFREAYERTGKILNVSCVPSDPHSPTMLMNYLTAPDCVVWSAVLGSAAVPGILNPVPMMMKDGQGRLVCISDPATAPQLRERGISTHVPALRPVVPYAFGHKWKDGSLRTDIPLKALNLHFGVTFSVVSQVNPHINAFFYSSKGTVGRPVTHRRGRGWRGGYLGSAVETYLKLEMQKFLKMLRHLELLPRPLGQDWSGIWLQQFSGTITIWPKSRLSDFWYILSDPSPLRLARMLLAGQQSTWPKMLFMANRMKIESLIEEGLRLGESPHPEADDRSSHSSQVDAPLAIQVRRGVAAEPFSGLGGKKDARRASVIEELKRQSRVFFDDSTLDGDETGESEYEESDQSHKGGHFQ